MPVNQYARLEKGPEEDLSHSDYLPFCPSSPILNVFQSTILFSLVVSQPVLLPKLSSLVQHTNQMTQEERMRRSRRGSEATSLSLSLSLSLHQPVAITAYAVGFLLAGSPTSSGSLQLFLLMMSLLSPSHSHSPCGSRSTCLSFVSLPPLLLSLLSPLAPIILSLHLDPSLSTMGFHG